MTHLTNGCKCCYLRVLPPMRSPGGAGTGVSFWFMLSA